ncbi:hypothetical protein TIFTF001_053274 [Ficus carica]|uniref:Uncharacterized protein n=1 Tax=Ficus carica TaxID=3494 RepID=A0AA88JJ98_FICCA|nr:hypothetical protein TIFTF001_053274 [Ficus carica]
MSFNEAGINLHWHPKWEQTYFGHSNPEQDRVRWQASLPVTYRPVQGRVGLWIELEMDWPPQPLHSCTPGYVSCVADNYVVLAERKLTSYVYAVGGSLQSWYQSGFLLYHFTIYLPSPPSLLVAMDPAHIDEDRDAVTSFYEAHPLSFDGTSRTIPLGAWLYNMELIFCTSHIPDHVQVSLGSRCLIGDARLWWILVGEPQLPSRTWVHFRTLVTARFGPILDYGPGASQRDPDIYRDMYDTRYHSYTLE